MKFIDRPQSGEVGKLLLISSGMLGIFLDAATINPMTNKPMFAPMNIPITNPIQNISCLLMKPYPGTKEIDHIL
jgi:hypothetical protein